MRGRAFTTTASDRQDPIPEPARIRTRKRPIQNQVHVLRIRFLTIKHPANVPKSVLVVHWKPTSMRLAQQGKNYDLISDRYPPCLLCQKMRETRVKRVGSNMAEGNTFNVFSEAAYHTWDGLACIRSLSIVTADTVGVMYSLEHSDDEISNNFSRLNYTITRRIIRLFSFTRERTVAPTWYLSWCLQVRVLHPDRIILFGSTIRQRLTWCSDEEYLMTKAGALPVELARYWSCAPYLFIVYSQSLYRRGPRTKSQWTNNKFSIIFC